MDLTELSRLCCNKDNCAAVFQSDRNTVIVQGTVLDAKDQQGLRLSPAENAVEIPTELLLSAVQRLIDSKG